MATSSTKTICIICNKEMRTYLCDGCSQRFCRKHLDEHQKNLEKELDQIETNHDELRQTINDQKQDPRKHPLMNEIDQWESKAIDTIKQTANQCREKFINYTNSFFVHVEKKLDYLAQQMKEIRHENEFNDLDVNQMSEKLNQLKEDLLQPPNLSIKQQSTSFFNFISLQTPWDTPWKQNATTIAGGNGEGDRLDQLFHPWGICIDDNDQTIYIADSDNARIVEWTSNATNNRIVAGGNGTGDQNNQLNEPSDVIIDREDNSIIIVDQENRRVIRRSRQNNSHGEIIISDIDCCGVTMHKDGSLYVSDSEKNEVRRWEKGETNGTIVAGGNGQGEQLDQFNCPAYLFVDDNHALYVSDRENHRVMKWVKDEKEGIVVAGGNGQGNRMTQLSSPEGVLVDQIGQIYVADWGNDRVMRWCEGAKEGTIAVGGNGKGDRANQLSGPVGLSFDSEGNLHVSDCSNHRIQKFVVDETIIRLM